MVSGLIQGCWRRIRQAVRPPRTRYVPRVGYDVDPLEARQLLAAPVNLVGGLEGQGASNLVPLGNYRYFIDARTAADALWRTDGTPAGTQVVAEISGGISGELKSSGEALAFRTGASLWASDGTPDGTRLLKDFGNATLSDPEFVGDTIFFVVTVRTGFQVWTSDGTPAGTVMAYEDTTHSGQASSLTAVGGRVFFRIQTNFFENELWTSDGTPEGTVRVPLDVQRTEWLTVFQGGLYASTLSYPLNAEVFYIDPSTLAYSPVLSFTGWAPQLVATPMTLYAASQSLWAAAGDQARDELAPLGPWPLGANAVFALHDGALYAGGGGKLWRSDFGGSTNFASPTSGVNDRLVSGVSASDRLYFFHRTSSSGQQLWSTDGTSSGTVRVTDHDAWLGGMTSPVFTDGAIEFFSAAADGSWGLWSMPVGIPTYITLTNSVQSTKVGEPVEWTAAVRSAAGVPSGQVVFKNGAQVLGVVPLDAQGIARLTYSALPVGNNAIEAEFVGQTGFDNAVAGPGKQSVSPRQWKAVIDPTSQPDVFTLRVEASDAGFAVVPTGVVTVYWRHPPAVLTLDASGAATVSLELPPGSNDVYLEYSGDATFGAGESYVRVPIPRLPSRIGLKSIGATRVLRNDDFLMAVAVEGDVRYSVDGSVRIIDAATAKVLAKKTIVGRSEHEVWFGLPPGKYQVAAVYLGNESLLESTSDPVSVEVGPKGRSSVSLHGELVSPREAPQLSLEAFVVGNGNALARGKATFYEGDRILGAVPVKDDLATLIIPRPAPGVHSYSVRYGGDANYVPSVSESEEVTIKSGVRISVSGGSRPTFVGKEMTLTAKVEALTDGSPATGEVSFRVNSRTRGTAPLTGGVATLRLTLPPGEHEVRVQFRGSTWLLKGDGPRTYVTVHHPTVVDLMVLYTPQARRSRPNIEAQIREAVADANTVLNNSKVPVTVRLVRAQEVKRQESGDYEQELDWLSESGEVAALRKRYGADLVSLFVAKQGKYAGLAYVLPRPRDDRNVNRAFSVVHARGSTAPHYVLAHELGHNFGAAHDEENTEGNALFPYAHGHRFTVGRDVYHDVMSYPPGETIPFYSNPGVRYRGVPVGDSDANVARVIREVAPLVSAYLPLRTKYGADPFA